MKMNFTEDNNYGIKKPKLNREYKNPYHYNSYAYGWSASYTETNNTRTEYMARTSGSRYIMYNYNPTTGQITISYQ